MTYASWTCDVCGADLRRQNPIVVTRPWACCEGCAEVDWIKLVPEEPGARVPYARVPRRIREGR